MDDQVQRVIESADGDDDTQGFTLGKRHAPGAGRGQVHRHDLARIAAQRRYSALDAVDRPGDLGVCVGDRLAALAHRRFDKLSGALLHQGDGPLKDGEPFVNRQPRFAVAEKRIGGCQRILHIGAVVFGDGVYRRQVKRIDHGQRFCGGFCIG